MSNISIDSQLNLADAFHSFYIQGCYVLVGYIVKIDSNGDPFWLITVADCTGTLTLYSDNQDNVYSSLKPNGLVSIKAKSMISGAQSYYQCEYIKSVEPIRNRFKSLQQLPKALCPRPDSLNLMVELVDGISDGCLSRFVLDVLSEPEVGIAYIRNPGSIAHHHNYAGGLLQHSVEVAQYFYEDTQLSRTNRDLGIVASLFHDIGKTLVYTCDINYSALGYLVSHDSLTLEICSMALSRLSNQNAGHANQLRHAWTCSTANSRYGYKPKTTLARQLQYYDSLSASLCDRANAPLSYVTNTQDISIESICLLGV